MAEITDFSAIQGKMDITIYYPALSEGVRIPAEMLVDDIEVANGEEQVSTVTTFAGEESEPNGTYSSPQINFSIKLNMKALRLIQPNISTNSNDRPTVAGQTIFGGSECTVTDDAILIVHQTCGVNSDNDLQFPRVKLSKNFGMTLSPGEVFTLPFQAYILGDPDNEGALAVYGTGDLDEPTLFDVETGEYAPIESA
jgi:hypothetical protein